jgi:hypothetical protein
LRLDSPNFDDWDFFELGRYLDVLARYVDYDVVLSDPYTCHTGDARELLTVGVADLGYAIQLAVGLPKVIVLGRHPFV